jgi:pyruvate/2-oxoglutarate/acetoin dehydrogenase E1 component
VLVIENLPIYKQRGEVPNDPDFITPLGRARVVREGSDITLVEHSYATVRALAVAERLAAEGIAAEVIDLRSLRPLDMETVARSLAKTNRALCVEEGLAQLRGHGRAGRPDPERLLRRPRRARRPRRDGGGAAALRQEPRAGRAAARG